MELVIKHFNELTAAELYDILKLRVDVFVVEQECPYPEIDNKDQNAYHVWLKDEEGIAASAYTIITLSGASEPPTDRIDLHFDRPFLFVVESADGLPLFMGTVYEP